MDASASEWSSGCESGWTVYLDESSQSPNRYQRGSRRSGRDHGQGCRPNCEEEEDLSMVSDASSGPPHVRYEEEEEEEVECFRTAGFYYPPAMEKAKKKAAKEPRDKKHHQHSYLDDTASSPDLNCSKKYIDPSKNQPVIGHGVGQGSFGFWPSSHPKRQDPAEPSLFRGRR